MSLGSRAHRQLGNQQSIKAMADATLVVAQDVARASDPGGRIRVIEASDPMVSMYSRAVLASETYRGDTCAAWIGGVGWAAWQHGALRRFEFPPVGGTSVIAWTPGPMGIL